MLEIYLVSSFQMIWWSVLSREGNKIQKKWILKALLTGVLTDMFLSRSSYTQVQKRDLNKNLQIDWCSTTDLPFKPKRRVPSRMFEVQFNRWKEEFSSGRLNIRKGVARCDRHTDVSYFQRLKLNLSSLMWAILFSGLYFRPYLSFTSPSPIKLPVILCHRPLSFVRRTPHLVDGRETLFNPFSLFNQLLYCCGISAASVFLFGVLSFMLNCVFFCHSLFIVCLCHHFICSELLSVFLLLKKKRSFMLLNHS